MMREVGGPLEVVKVISVPNASSKGDSTLDEDESGAGDAGVLGLLVGPSIVFLRATPLMKDMARCLRPWAIATAPAFIAKPGCAIPPRRSPIPAKAGGIFSLTLFVGFVGFAASCASLAGEATESANTII